MGFKQAARFFLSVLFLSIPLMGGQALATDNLTDAKAELPNPVNVSCGILDKKTGEIEKQHMQVTDLRLSALCKSGAVAFVKLSMDDVERESGAQPVPLEEENEN